jgi:diguanylate cyclase (GGDEF)-like protein
VGRWGGEELLLLLAETTLQEATSIAERVRATIAATPLTLADGRQIALTASLGVASTETSGERTLEALVRDADAALYRAKAAGRNCVRST